MGKNKGKGASNLRRINSEKKRSNAFEKEYARLKAMGLPDVTFDSNTMCIHKSEELREIKND